MSGSRYGRFGKAAISGYVNDRIDNIQREFNFDPGNGTAQCRNEQEHCAYGEYRGLLDLVVEFDLPCLTHDYDRERSPRRR